MLFVVNFHNTSRAAQLERPVESFTWLYGGEYGLNTAADSALGRSGYRYLFSNLKIQELPR